MKRTLLILSVIALFLSSCRKIEIIEPGTQVIVKDGKILARGVDLGLTSGLKWADCNLGTSSIKSNGKYYDHEEYDVVENEWGNGWRTPTKEDFEELIEECEWEWIGNDDAGKYKVEGPNGNYIYLPAAGYRSNNAVTFEKGESGYYATSTLNGWNFIYVLQFTSSYYYMSTSSIEYQVGGSNYTRTIRPVLE